MTVLSDMHACTARTMGALFILCVGLLKFNRRLHFLFVLRLIGDILHAWPGLWCGCLSMAGLGNHSSFNRYTERV